MVLRVLLAVVLVLALPFTAEADRVDDLVRQLKTDRDYKVRLSAALTLGRLKDRRAVPALVSALGDENKSVRGVAAAALAKIVDREVPIDLRRRVIRELKKVSEKDPDAFVRGQAKKAYDALAPLGEEEEAPSGGGVYVEVGPMSDNTKKGGAEIKAHMRDTVSRTLVKSGNGIVTAWPTGKSPSQKELEKSRTKAAFYVDGSLKSVDVERTGSRAQVSCQVSIFVATFPDKSMFAFADGGAAVETSSKEKDIEEAKRDCVGAVLDSLVAQKLVPVIVARSR